MSENECLTPEDVTSEAKDVIQGLLPPKSREIYLKTYENFIMWKNGRGAKSFSENVFLSYFQVLAKTKLPSTLWSTFSMLKATVNTRNDIKIDTYSKLITFLKRQSEGHKPKKSKVLSRQNVESFLNEAPDEMYLLTKVVLVFGVHGACRSKELLNITMNDVEAHSDELLLIKLKDTKTKIDRSFTIQGEYKLLVEKYQKLRPSDTKTDRFFIRYQNGKCTRQQIGKNRFSSMPQEIASYLMLPEAKLYTGHCFRRTSATLLADTGVDMSVLKRHGGWKSSSVAEGYVEESIENKANICHRVVENINLKVRSPQPSTSKEDRENIMPQNTRNSPEKPISQKLHTETAFSETITNSQVVNTNTTVTDGPNKIVTLHFHQCSNMNVSF